MSAVCDVCGCRLELLFKYCPECGSMTPVGEAVSEQNKRPNENGPQATADAPQKQVLALAGMSDEALGREVAERVMGWHKGYQIGHPYWFSGEERDWKVEALHDEHPSWQSMDSMSGKIYHRWSPATDIKDAWEVLLAVKERLFSERREFCMELTRQVGIAWPDALFYLEPAHICRAALRVVTTSPYCEPTLARAEPSVQPVESSKEARHSQTKEESQTEATK